ALTGCRRAMAAANGSSPRDVGKTGAPVILCVRALLVLTVAALAAALAPAAVAQDNAATASYITPFPEADTYRLQVYGDAFAEGLLAGLIEAFAGDNRVQIARKHRSLAGIAR